MFNVNINTKTKYIFIFYVKVITIEVMFFFSATENGNSLAFWDSSINLIEQKLSKH